MTLDLSQRQGHPEAYQSLAGDAENTHHTSRYNNKQDKEIPENMMGRLDVWKATKTLRPKGKQHGTTE